MSEDGGSAAAAAAEPIAAIEADEVIDLAADNGSSTEDDADDDNDSEDAIEVEVTSAGGDDGSEDDGSEDDGSEDDGSEDDGSDDDDDEETDAVSSTVSTSPAPSPAANAKSTTPKMRIKLRLKMPSRKPSAEASDSGRGSEEAGGAGGSSNVSTPTSEASKGDESYDTNADTDADDEEENEEAATTEAMVVDDSDDVVMAEAVEEVAVAVAKPQQVKAQTKADKQSLSSAKTSTRNVAEEDVTSEQSSKTSAVAETAQQPETSTTRPPSAAVNELTNKGHPFHKPAAERAPPPSLSRPAALNPQLSYTTTGGQGGGYHSRAVRLPAILSPGLLAIPNAHNSVGIQVCDTDAYKMLHDMNKGKGGTTGSRKGDADAEDESPDATAGKKRSSKSGAVNATTFDNDSDPYEHYYTASSVFTHYMAAAGYTAEARSKNPHLGSSLRRTVGDMFDLDVMSSAHFPKLIPDYMKVPINEVGKDENCNGAMNEGSNKAQGHHAKHKVEASATAAATSATTCTIIDEAKTDKLVWPPAASAKAGNTNKTLLSMLKSTLKSTRNKRKRELAGYEESEASKRFCPQKFEEMVPVSLTYPYPEEYMQARRDYAQKVKEREEAIAKDQAAAESASEIMNAYNEERSRWQSRLEAWERARAECKAETAVVKGLEINQDEQGSHRAVSPSPPEEPNLPPLPAPVPIPPIPTSPRPPEWEDQATELDADKTRTKVKRPSSETLRHYTTYLRHLDPSTFLSTVPTPTARYAGLTSNSITDANFVGPVAPGIAGIGLGLGSGLSSAYVSASGGQGGGGLHSSSYYEGLKRTFEEHKSVGSGGGSGRCKDLGSPKAAAVGSSDAKTKKKKTKKKKFKLPLHREQSPPRPAVVTSSSDLKKLMENGGQEAEKMRMAIIKAAIYAARMGKKAGDTFVGSDGKGYRDVQRAFSNYARVKPCPRCRGNKQGAFHCRIRRKHKDGDFDGGDSSSELQPFFTAPMESLVCKYTGGAGTSTSAEDK